MKGVWDHPAQPDINIATMSTAPSRIRMSATSTIQTRSGDHGWRESHFLSDTSIGTGSTRIPRFEAMREAKGRKFWLIRLVTTALGAMMLTLSACASTGAICEESGGTYSGGTCTRWSPGQEAAQKWCETHGGSYLAGPNVCAFGEGQ